MFLTYFAVLFAAISGLAQTVPPPASHADADFPAWVAPQPRLNAKEPFAPKPSTGNNIFKGEGEKWLSDAVLELEAGHLSPIKDKAVADYITQLGNDLVANSTGPKLSYEFVVLDDEEVNAMCVGAGRIYVNLGLLKQVENEDELAGVIGHEIGHNILGHLPKTVTRQLFWMKGITKVDSPATAKKALDSLDTAYRKNEFATFGELLLGFGRNDELAADKSGFYTMYKAGYDTEFYKDFLRRDVQRSKKELGKDYGAEQFLIFLLGDHPPSSQRVAALNWETNWIKKPSKKEPYKSAAFDSMKLRVAKM